MPRWSPPRWHGRRRLIEIGVFVALIAGAVFAFPGPRTTSAPGSPAPTPR